MQGASLTGRIAAAYRARASSRENAICADPWARLLAGENQEELVDGDGAAELELGIALRTAWLDDAVAAFEGPQIVVLGAGLDTRAARLAKEGRTFYEVDDPATQMHKRSAIAVLKDYPQGTSTFVPCDLEKTDFASALLYAGFDPAEASLVIWEGATPYVTEGMVAKTIAHVVELGATRFLLDTVGQANGQDSAVSFLTDDIAPMLKAGGFTDVYRRSVRAVHHARLAKDAGEAPLFDRWYFVEARR